MKIDSHKQTSDINEILDYGDIWTINEEFSEWILFIN